MNLDHGIINNPMKRRGIGWTHKRNISKLRLGGTNDFMTLLTSLAELQIYLWFCNSWVMIVDPFSFRWLISIYRSCTGAQETRFTDTICVEKKSTSIGCYNDDFHGEWRACSLTCNEKIITGQDGKRCRDYCESMIYIDANNSQFIVNR